MIASWSTLPSSVKEPLKSAAVATALSIQTAFLVLVGAAAQAGQVGSPGDLAAYVASHWWGVAIGFILPAAYRARQGATAAANTVQLAGGVSAVITQPKGS